MMLPNVLVLVGLIAGVFSLPFCTALAEDLESLLKHTEEVLSPGDRKPQQDRSAPASKPSSPRPSNPRQSSTKNLTPQNQKSLGQELKQGSEQPSQPMLAPEDAEAIRELSGISLNPELSLRGDLSQSLLSLGLGASRLRGDFFAEKDDDTFAFEGAPWMLTINGRYEFSLLDQPFFAETAYKFMPYIGLSAAMMSAPVDRQRRGVRNEVVRPHMTLFSSALSLGVYVEPSTRIRVGAHVGYGAEVLVQSGQGQTDSTSAMFGAEVLTLNFDYVLMPGAWVGILLQSSGIRGPSAQESGRDMLGLRLVSSLSH